jgi:hypothetical protein
MRNRGLSAFDKARKLKLVEELIGCDACRGQNAAQPTGCHFHLQGNNDW